jgi:hypothetical protein
VNLTNSLKGDSLINKTLIALGLMVATSTAYAAKSGTDPVDPPPEPMGSRYLYCDTMLRNMATGQPSIDNALWPLRLELPNSEIQLHDTIPSNFRGEYKVTSVAPSHATFKHDDPHNFGHGDTIEISRSTLNFSWWLVEPGYPELFGEGTCSFEPPQV